MINLLLRQRGTENTVKPKGTKTIVKPVKSLVELAANQLERTIMRPATLLQPDTSNRVKSLKHLATNVMVKDKIKFFENKAKEKDSVITYDMKPVSIEDIRYEELDKARVSRFKSNSTFQKLFEERLKHMTGKRENVQITINADVEKMLGNASEITSKTYGPFKISVPKLNNEDMYKYMIYTLLRVRFVSGG